MTMWPIVFDSAILFAGGFTLFQLVALGAHLMSTQDAVNALTAQVAKIQNEVIAARDVLTAKLADVQAQLDAAGVTEQVDLSELEAAVQALDDVNPDPVADVDPVVDPVAPTE